MNIYTTVKHEMVTR